MILVGLLRQYGKLSAAELARRLEVDRRTVLRDIEALSTAGVPVYALRGRNGGFALLPGYQPDPAELTEDETAALFVAGGRTALGRLGVETALASALNKLASGLPARLRDTVEHQAERIVVDPAGWILDPEPVPELPTVQAATFADRRLRFRYTPRQVERAGLRTVDPYGLLLAGSAWYLLAGHRGRPRAYRVSRMARAVIVNAPAQRPDDLDLRRLWAELRAGYAGIEGIRVRLRIRTPFRDLLLRNLSGQLTRPAGSLPADDDWSGLELSVQGLRGAAGVIAGFGAMVEIADPPELRHLLADLGRELIALDETSRP